MINNFSLNEISQNPQYNFLNKMVDNDEMNFYQNTDIKCDYIDLDNFDKLKLDEFKILSWNIRSLTSNFVHLRELIDIFEEKSIDFHVLGIIETWNIGNLDMVQLDNFEFVHKQRKKANGGGCGFYIKKGLKYKIIRR